MRLNQILELSMVLDNERFQKVVESAHRRSRDLEENDYGYIDRSLERKGIMILYRNSRYKKKVRLIVNTHLLIDDATDTDRLIRKLGKRITEYFNSRYHLYDFNVSGLKLVADIDVDTRSNAQAYIKVIKRIGKVKGFSPVNYEDFDDDSSFCLRGNSNGVEFLLYDLERTIMRQSDSKGMGRKNIKGVLRAEIRLTKAGTIRMFSDGIDAQEQLEDLPKMGRDIFIYTFMQIIPFGDYYKKDKALEIIRKEVADTAMIKQMLSLLILIPEKKSLHLAQKSMNCRNMDKVMDAFAKINLSPVTISERQDVKYLENIYQYIFE